MPGKPDARTFGQDLMRGENTNFGAGGGGGRGVTRKTLGAAPPNTEARHIDFYKRKRELEADLGRECTVEEIEQTYDEEAGHASGTSIFDPVLCELAYSWFCPPGGKVLDPFAGGSVRGIVAAMLGRHYTGVDLSERQVQANREQWERIGAPSNGVVGDPTDEDSTDLLTPVERIGDVWVKRDDTFCVAGVRGGKARAAWHLAQGARGLVTAGARQSPQVLIVARIAERLGVPCRAHVPSGALTAELRGAQAAGAEVVQHTPGRNSVIVARAREDAARTEWTLIPFGMECAEAVRQTSSQVANLPDEVGRIVIPVGSGMSLAGVLAGLREAGNATPVLGVVVGADPRKRLDAYAPGWRDSVELVDAGVPYEERVPGACIGDVPLDEVYEAKCLPFLQPGDLLWCVGRRPAPAPQHGTEQGSAEWVVGDSAKLVDLAPGEYDLVFSCPPYADLEVYSDDPADLSTMPYEQFLAAYRGIIAAAVGMLREDRFACFVVGEVRDKRGNYRGFVPDTIRAFEDAGARYYNEAVLLTSVGSLPVRAGRQFRAGRKLGKTHQNVLVFVKGDGKRATEVCGDVAVATLGEDGAPSLQ